MASASPSGKEILLFGAGKSSAEIIAYLLRTCQTHGWHLTVVDAQQRAILARTKGHPLSTAVAMDILSEGARRLALIRAADVVVSLLPPALHQRIAIDCLETGRHLLTASYTDNALREMAPAIHQKGLLFLCEMGLDPGIDHMSALKALSSIREKGGEVTAFRSHCGGLVAPESDDNPWHYKISWNPRNVVLAGKAGARYREDGEDRQVPYEQLFDPRRQVSVPGLGPLAWYPNRDSLEYATLYGLEQVPTFIRTTLRYPGFCSGWKHLVSMHLTDETAVYHTGGMTLAEFFRTHIRRYGWGEWLDNAQPFAEQIGQLLKISPAEAGLLEKQLMYLGWNAGDKIDKGLVSAADVLQLALETKLALRTGDKDMIVMLHEIRYRSEGKMYEWLSSLVVKGKDSLHTAMARTVGLPLGIAAVLLLQGRISVRGLHIPTLPEIYEPVLQQLAAEGIAFTDQVI
jgi:saccharopine dehydrogenase-like NADP-dependent oxidoreductase